MNIAKPKQTLRSKTKFGFDDKTSKQHDLWRNWITNDLVHSPSWNKSMLWPWIIQTSRFHENSSCVSCLFICLLFQKKFHEPPPPMKIDGEQQHEVEVFLTQGFQINNSSTSFIGMDMMWVNTFWELAKHLLNAMEKMKKFHWRYPNKPKASTPHVLCEIHC